MSSVDALLDSALGINKVILTIDPLTRTIETPNDLLLGVESDEKSKRIYFQCPRVVDDNVDLSKKNLYVNYENANAERSSYHIEDIVILDDGETIEFSWLIARHVAKYKGIVRFIVCSKKSDYEGYIEKEWNTTVATGNVLEGLEATQVIEEQSHDVIEQILAKLDETSLDDSEVLHGGGAGGAAEGTGNSQIINGGDADGTD